MELPRELFASHSSYRFLTGETDESIISCGTIYHDHRRVENAHCFNYYGALLLLSGNGVYVDENGVKTPICAGNFIQRLPHVKHTTVVFDSEEWLEYFVCFGMKTYESMRALGLIIDQPVLFAGITRELIAALVSLERTLAGCPDEKLPYALLDAQKIVLTVNDLHNENESDKSARPALAQAGKALRDGECSSAREAAERFGFGYESFRKLFKAAYGSAPTEYILSRRADRAKSMLLETDMTVGQIAQALGYPDIYAFSKQFRRLTGLPPTEFRAIHRY